MVYPSERVVRHREGGRVSIPPATCSLAAVSKSITESTSLIASVKLDLRMRANSASRGPKGDEGLSSSTPAIASGGGRKGPKALLPLVSRLGQRVGKLSAYPAVKVRYVADVGGF